MKVLVSVKRVVDYNVKVGVKSDGADVHIANVQIRCDSENQRLIPSFVAIHAKSGGQILKKMSSETLDLERVAFRI